MSTWKDAAHPSSPGPCPAKPGEDGEDATTHLPRPKVLKIGTSHRCGRQCRRAAPQTTRRGLGAAQRGLAPGGAGRGDGCTEPWTCGHRSRVRFKYTNCTPWGLFFGEAVR